VGQCFYSPPAILTLCFMEEDGFYVATRVVNPALVQYRHFIIEAYGLKAVSRPTEYSHLSDVAMYIRLEDLRDKLARGQLSRQQFAGEVLALLQKHPDASREAVQILAELYKALTGESPPPIPKPSERRVDSATKTVGVCPRCVLNGDTSAKPLFRCQYCGELYCADHVEPRLVMTFGKYQAYFQQYRDLASFLRDQWRKEGGHPCVAFTAAFWKEYESRRDGLPSEAPKKEEKPEPTARSSYRLSYGVKKEGEHALPVKVPKRARMSSRYKAVLAVLLVTALTLLFYDNILVALQGTSLLATSPNWVSTLNLKNLAFNGTHITLRLKNPTGVVRLTSSQGLLMTIYPELNPRRSDWLAPDYAILKKDSAVLIISAQRLLKALGQATGGVYTLELEGQGCSFKIENGKLLFKSACSELNGGVYVTITNRGILQAILLGYTDTALTQVKRAVWDGALPPSPLDAAWDILLWLEKNTEYDKFSAMLREDVLTPLEFLNTKRGICADYAVFTASAITSLYGEAYIVIMDTDREPHAAAGIVYGSKFLMVDQSRPPIEWDDYAHYVFTLKGDEIQLIKISINPELRLEIWTLSPSEMARKYPDSYPIDQTPPEIFVKAARYLVEKYEKVPSSGSCPTCPAIYFDIEDSCRDDFLCAVYTGGCDDEFAQMWAEVFDKSLVKSDYKRLFESARIIYIQLVGKRLYFYLRS